MSFDLRGEIDSVLEDTGTEALLANSKGALSKEVLRRNLMRLSDEIKAEVAGALAHYEDAQTKLNQAIRDVGLATEAKWTRRGLLIAITIVGAIAITAAISFPFGLFTKDWLVHLWDAMWTASWAAVPGWLLAGLTTFGITRGAYWHLWQKKKVRAEAEGSFEINRQRSTLRGAQNALKQEVQRATRSAVAEAINKASNPYFAGQIRLSQDPVRPHLPVTIGVGLSEAGGAAVEVPTAARRAINDLITSMPGGSIGISGPRGVGKSTLLRSICQTSLERYNRGVVAIYTTAPVEYNGRDFLLHLHAQLCRKVLELSNVPIPQGNDAALEESQSLKGTILEKQLSGLIALLFILGTFMLTSGLIFSAVMAPAILTSPSIPAAIQSSMPLVKDKSPNVSLAKLSIATPAPRSAQNEASSSAQGNGKVASSITGDALPKIIDAIGFKPGPLILLGVISLMGSAALFTFAQYQHVRLIMRPWRPHKPTRDRLIGIERESMAQLRNLRFQRSFTSGWSGAFKAPVGLELGASMAMTFAQAPQSLPELVDNFCLYVRDLANRYGRVVIGIDELDKMKSSSQAESFLNELKSVFNIEGCYYLISVSEHALASFERRGIGFRDAFDSALDDVYPVTYLDLAGSRSLLVRRVINLPDPFLYLCHMLSGGLPRDLIRITRDLLRIGHENDKPLLSLARAAAALVEQEIDSKVRAMSILLGTTDIEPQTSALISQLDEVNHKASLKQLLSGIASIAEPIANPHAQPASLQRLNGHREEIMIYLSFLVEVRRVARHMVSRAGWSEVQNSGVPEALAQARQALETNTHLALRRLDVARKAMGKIGIR